MWFLGCLDRAIIASEEGLANVINKAKFWDKLITKKLNARQKLMVNKLLDGFDGKLTSSKQSNI